MESEESESPGKTTEELCHDIKLRHRALFRSGRRHLEEAIDLGGLLHSVKERLDHGKWYPFLSEAELAPRVAQNYMRLYSNRDEMRAGYELNAHLTITASLKMLQSPKTKDGVPKSAGTTNGGADGPILAEIPRHATDRNANEDNSSRSPIPGEGRLADEHPGQPIHQIESLAESNSEQLKGGEMKAEMPVRKDIAESGVDDSVDGAAALVTTNPSREAATAPDSEGFLLVDGDRLQPDRWDDGAIPSGWVQMQISTLKRNNDSATGKLKRSVEALKAGQMFLIELARTANQLLDETKATTEPLIQILNSAVCTLRNYTNELSCRK